MKKWLFIFIIFAVLVGTIIAKGEDFLSNLSFNESFIILNRLEFFNQNDFNFLIVFRNPEGKEAKINFNGDKVIYSGDLPVEESAKLFFEAFKNLCPKCEKK